MHDANYWLIPTANGKLMAWCMAVESDAWQFTIEPAEEVFPTVGSSLDSDKKP